MLIDSLLTSLLGIIPYNTEQNGRTKKAMSMDSNTTQGNEARKYRPNVAAVLLSSVYPRERGSFHKVGLTRGKALGQPFLEN